MSKNEIFFCISNYNNDLRYLISLGYDYLIYDKTHAGGPADNDNTSYAPNSNLKEFIDSKKIISSSLNGYNIYDYLKFIIDHYDRLPKRVAFLKGNVVGRHVSQSFFVNCLNKTGFIGLFENKPPYINNNNLKSNGSFIITPDNFFLEKNTSYYLLQKKHPIKYFYSTKNFYNFCFKNSSFFPYLNFVPGACFIVDKENIMQYPKIFYKNLLTFITHHRVPGESLMLERLLPSILLNKYDLSENIKVELTQNLLDSLQKDVEKRNNIIYFTFRKFIGLFTKIFGYLLIRTIKIIN